MFSKNLRALRLKRGLSQKQLAGFLVVSAQSVSKWEKGEALPSIDYLPKLAECLDCDVNAFFAEEQRCSAQYTTVAPLFEAMVDVLNEKRSFDEMIALISENTEIIDTAIAVCGELMAHKTLNVRSVRRILGCSETEARTFLGYLERCELAEPLDVEDFYYVIKDAVEGFVVLLKMQLQLYEVSQRYEKDRIH